jgi:hypothetical protein
MSHQVRTWSAAVVIGLIILSAATAKEPFDLPPAGQDTIAVSPDAGRLTEILIELAWLADPLTFPYYLEARVQGSTLQVRGFVPSKVVRDQAFKLARLHSPLPVSDGTTVRPGIAGKPAHIPAAQLEKAARACLCVSLPGADSRFQLQTDNAGRIKVMGRAHSFEEKLAVSQGLRRLHGCTVVVNMVHVEEAGLRSTAASIPKPHDDNSAMDLAWPDKPKPNKPKPVWLAAAPAPKAKSKSFLEHLGFTAPKAPPAAVVKSKVKTSPPARAIPTFKTNEKLENHDVKVVSATYGVGIAKETKETKEIKEPYVSHGTVLVKEEPAPVSAEAQMQKHIAAACAIRENNLQLHFQSATELNIHIQAKDQDQANSIAQRIFQLPELLPYHVDLKVTVPR